MIVTSPGKIDSYQLSAFSYQLSAKAVTIVNFTAGLPCHYEPRELSPEF
jgi:hypothetical protein